MNFIDELWLFVNLPLRIAIPKIGFLLTAGMIECRAANEVYLPADVLPKSRDATKQGSR